MDSKLYVGNLPYQTTEDDLRTLFAQAGTVSAVDIIKDRETGYSKGFAFVTMESQSDAENAIRMFNGQTIGNREIKVNIARPREDRFQGGNRGGGGGYGGGFGGGGGGRGQGNRGGGDRDRRGGGGGTRRY
ncbi:MAG: RNA-binding protein [Anaerolineaceae bacterium]|jgi:cold-inducible RNA-binding protein|nr:RNA-binding protein [Anaerolineaceae bacterium]